ncbi:CHRNA7-FAM7A fusion protein-like [Salmo salar]|uniref:CHRNA7-FAM7A fusion protein-like n=1 Tax=Salmo salar TaxID=8030 RepID=A0ABM3ERM6_SALSA|nr:CHRNA7-FAM7A fusion protein-like [Salmo salar]
MTGSGARRRHGRPPMFTSSELRFARRTARTVTAPCLSLSVSVVPFLFLYSLCSVVQHEAVCGYLSAWTLSSAPRAHDKFDATFKSYVLVNSSGFCEYLPPGIFSSACNVDMRWFPFDIQRCELKFGSWTFDGWLLDLQMQEADLSGYMSNGEWELLVESSVCPRPSCISLLHITF